jgi:cardiolipin synthase
METRTSQGAIAWAIVLLTFPVLAVPAYWIFGRNHVNGYRKRRIREQLELQLGSKVLGGMLSASRVRDESLTRRMRMLEEITGSPFTSNNQVELLINGAQTFASMFSGIACARDHVLVSFYIMRHDEIGEPFKRALIERVRAGVAVRVMYDGIGTPRAAGSMFEELRAAGVKVVAFDGSRHPGNRLSLNFRNHRKIVAVDGARAWVGGLNIGREYAGMDHELGHWRDTHVCITGPAALAVQAVVIEDWLWATGESLEALLWKPRVKPPADPGPVEALDAAAATGAPTDPGASEALRSVLVAPTSPASNIETCTLLFMQLISQARTRLWIASPYFVPDEQFVTQLQLAALRGVDVRILLPSRPDQKLVQLASYAYLKPLGDTGVHFFRYMRGFLHQKVVLVDDDLASVGTVNFDNRSFRLNFEISVLVQSRSFAAQVAAMLEDDFTHCKRIGTDLLERRGLAFSFLVRAARLLAPVL